MSLDLFNNLTKDNNENNGFIQNFLSELRQVFSDIKKIDEINNDSKDSTILNQQKKEEINDKSAPLREENGLYLVVDRCYDGVYIQNTKSYRIFKETNIPDELMDDIYTDVVLRYKDGKYVYDKEKTYEHMENFIGIQEYEDIKKKFAEESNITEINSDTIYKVVSRENGKNGHAVLSYSDENNNINEIEVPSPLVPFFIDEDTVLQYREECFKKYFGEGEVY